jgi:heat-inducible transcriptional repressor
MSSPAFPGRLTPGDPELTDRQRAVFTALVTLHGRAAGPISSDHLASRAGLGLSAASVRITLSELESLGLLERSHASAGRRPSARGYEVFVRALVTPVPLPDWAEREIEERLGRSFADVERLLHEASRLLASLTRQLGLAVAAPLEQGVLIALDLEAIGARRALLTLEVDGGGVRSLVLELDTPLAARDLSEVEEVLRERLIDHPLGEVRRRLATDPALVRHAAARMVAHAAAQRWSRLPSTPLLAAGAGHMAVQPEFSRPDSLAPLLDVVEAGSPLDRWLVHGAPGRAEVRVGLTGGEALAACSLVHFALPGGLPGAVGVLGPLRMDYALALTVVEQVGLRVADRLPE